MNRSFSSLVSSYDPLPGFEEANPGMIDRINEWAEDTARFNRARQALERAYQSDLTRQLERLVMIDIEAKWMQIQTVFGTITIQRLTLIVYQGTFAMVFEKTRVLISSY